MATNSGTRKRNTGASKNTTRNTTKNTTKNTRGRGKSSSGQTINTPRQRTEQERMISNELSLLIFLAVAVLLFLCNFGIIGPVGNMVSGFMFGIFGMLAYVAPVFIFIAIAFGMSNQGNFIATLKLIAAIILFLIVGSFLHIFQAEMSQIAGYSITEIYNLGKDLKLGGGVLCGSIAYLLYSLLDTIGSILILIVLAIGCIVIITEKSFFNGVKKGSQYVVSSARDDAIYRREKAKQRKEELLKQREKQREQREQQREQQLEQKASRNREKQEQEIKDDASKILRMDKKVSGVMLDTKLTQKKPEEPIRHDNLPSRPSEQWEARLRES